MSQDSGSDSTFLNDEHSEASDDDFEIVRMSAERGTFDKDGKKVWKKICDLTDDHLEAILDYGGSPWHLELIRKEIDYRKNNMV